MDYIVGFLLLLGVLVFIHEFGHFYVAKLCGMKVEVFSIGMGKKILKWKSGETEYALSLFPLGGYVKILGQDPREDVSPHEAERSFRNKAVWQKAAVVLAGPIANLILAYFVFVVLFQSGLSSPAAELVRILPASPAAAAGFQNGDRVKALQTSEGKVLIHDLSELQEKLHTFQGQKIGLLLDRAGQETQIEYTPVLKNQRHPKLGILQQRGSLDGVEYLAPAPSVSIEAGSWVASQQIPGPLYIEEISVSGPEAKTWKLGSFADLEKAWSEAVASQTANLGKIELKASVIETLPAGSQEPQSQTFTLAWADKSKAAPATLEKAGLVSSEMLITDVIKDSPAERAGLVRGDRLLGLNGEKLVSFFYFRDRIQELAAEGKPLNLEWKRGTEVIRKDVTAQLITDSDPITETKKSRFQIGAAFLSLKAAPPLVEVKGENFLVSLKMGAKRTWDLTMTMIQSFYHLAVGDISLKTLGSPIMIAKISGESIKQGWSSFFQMMAFISLNLFILNLLPIPVLDGGHLVLFSIEAILRRPISVKVLEIWTTTGVVLLLMLMGVAFFNDFNRFGLLKFLSS
jgi:regulator of sigma E protease